MGNAIRESVSAMFTKVLQLIFYYHCVKGLGKVVFEFHAGVRSSNKRSWVTPAMGINYLK